MKEAASKISGWLTPAAVLAGAAVSLAAGFTALTAAAWLAADPGCHCLADRMDMARRLFSRWWPAGLAAAGCLFWAGFLAAGRLSRRHDMLRAAAYGFILAALALAVSFASGFPEGLYAATPIELALPADLLGPIGPALVALRTWRAALAASVFLATAAIFYAIAAAKK